MRSPTARAPLSDLRGRPRHRPVGVGGEGRNSETLGRFFDELGAARAARLTHVSCDGAAWIHTLVAQRAPQALICLDPFHVVAWALKALDRCGCAP